MHNSIYLAKSLLILSYSLLFLLLGLILAVAVWEPLFQVLFFISFIILVGLSYESFYSAFLLTVGGARADSALRRVGGVAELVDNLHEYTQLDGLLRFTQSSLTSLLGANSTKLLIDHNFFEVENAVGKDFLLCSKDEPATLSADAALFRYASNVPQGFRIEDSPLEIIKDLQRFDARFAIPVFCHGEVKALLLISNWVVVVTDLQTLLAFFARQFGIVLERIVQEQGRRLRQENAFAEKSAAMAMLSATIAHEMRTPLSGVRASIGGVESYLPDLIAAYQFAHEKDAEQFPLIRKDLLDTLTETGPRIKSMVDQANHVIDLLLVNLNDQGLDSERFTVCSARECVEQALEQYPFRRLEREKINLKTEDDFELLGIKALLVYVLFNLIKNALYSLESAEKGEITIDLVSGERCNYLIFEDTGLGMEEEIVPMIFDGFFTTRNNGTGAGLAFCKRTMQSFDGDIRVSSEIGKFTRFTLEFPHI